MGDLGLTSEQVSRLNDNPLLSAEASGSVYQTSSHLESQPEVEEPDNEQATQEKEIQQSTEEQDTASSFDLDAVLNEKYGINSEDLKAGIEFVKSFQTSQMQVQAYQSLGESWGVDQNEVSRRLAIVAEEFQKLPEEERPAYDNVNGALKIWKDLESRVGVSAKTPMRGKTAKSPSSKSSYDFTQAQIDAMGPEERQRNDRRIQAAYAAGRVYGAL